MALTHKRPQGSEYVYSRKSMELESDSCCCASSLLRAMLAQIGKQEVFNIQMTTNAIMCHLRSVAGLVIQATGRTDFEDGSRTATTLEVSNGLHRVRTTPEVSMAGPN